MHEISFRGVCNRNSMDFKIATKAYKKYGESHIDRLDTNSNNAKPTQRMSCSCRSLHVYPPTSRRRIPQNGLKILNI